MPVVVDSRVRVPIEEVGPSKADRIRDAFTHPNPLYGKEAGEPQTIRTWEHDAAGNLTVPRGGLEKLLDVVGREPGTGFRPRDETVWEHPEDDFPDHLKELRDYQEEMVDAAVAGVSGILRAGTGTGKTTAGFGLLACLKRRALVMVRNGGLLKQWRDRAVEELGLEPEEVGHVQGSRTRVRPLTLCMQQSLYERFSAGDCALADAFDVFLYDEVQTAAARTVMQAVDPIRARYRIGVSADETRHDQLEPLIYDLFGPVLHVVEDRRVIDSGAVVEVEVAYVPTKFAAPWYRFDRSPNAFHRLLDEMVADEARNKLVLSLVKSAVASGEQVMVFTHRVEHARNLDAAVAEMGIPGGLMLGGVENAMEFDRTKARLKAGELRVATGTYEAIGAGIDVPSLGRGICATPIGNNRQKLGQVKGRVCRASEGKTKGKLAYLLDASIYGRKPVENGVDWFRDVTVWNGREWVAGRDYLSWLRTRRAV